MKAQIYINPKTALLAGLNNQGVYSVEFDPADLTPDQRRTLAECDIDSETKAYRTHLEGNYIGDWGAGIAAPNLDALRAVLNARRKTLDAKAAEKAAKEADYEAQRRAAVAEWVESPPEDRVVFYNMEWRVRVRQYLPALNGKTDLDYVKGRAEVDHAVREALEDANALAFWQNLEAEVGTIITRRSSERAAAERKAEQEAAASRRKAQIAAWVAKHGNDNMKERLAVGLLPTEEVKNLIRDQAYAPLDEFARYEKMKAEDVCDGVDDYYDNNYRYHDVKFGIKTSKSLSAKSFEHMKKIRTAIGDNAEIEPRDHCGTCGECNNTVYRVGFMVRIKVGELEFSREYASPGL
jgi:hypothetical protein